MIHFSRLFALIASVLLVLISMDSFGSDKAATDDTKTGVRLTEMASQSDPAALVDYSWRIVDSLHLNDRPCRNERCFREGDSILVLNHGNGSPDPCKTDLTLVMNDPSSGYMRFFNGIDGVLSNCEAGTPTSVKMNFWDPTDDIPVCRKIEISPVRMSESVSVTDCKDKLQRLSMLSDDAFEILMSGSCDLHPLIHWKVSDVEPADCGDGDRVTILNPPEPGQGTGSGGSD